MLRTLSCFSRPPAGKRQSHQVSQSGTRRRRRRRWQQRPQPRSSSLAARRPLRQRRRRRRPVFVQLSNSVSIRTRECECVFGRSVGRRSVRYLKTIIEECTKLRRRERERHAAFGNRNLDAASLLRWSVRYRRRRTPRGSWYSACGE